MRGVCSGPAAHREFSFGSAARLLVLIVAALLLLPAVAMAGPEIEIRFDGAIIGHNNKDKFNHKGRFKTITRTYEIRNKGDSALTVTDISFIRSVGGSTNTDLQTTPLILAQNATAVLSVSYNLINGGEPYAFRIEIQSDAANYSPFVFSIIGNGYSPSELATQGDDQFVRHNDDDDDDDDDRPSLSITRDGQPVGASDPQGEHPMNEAVALSYTLTNDGEATISIGDVTFTDNAGSVSRGAVTIDDAPIPDDGFDLDPDGSATLAFTYTPLEEAGFDFDMEIEPETGGDALRTVRLFGSGYDAVKRKAIEDTVALIGDFVHQRSNGITLDDLDLTTRLDGGLDGTGGKPLGFAANGTLDNLDLQFATSLGLLSAGSGSHAAGAHASPFDIWVKGRYTRVESGTAETDLFIGTVGIDYRLNEDLVAGLIGQVDWADYADDTGATVDGTGWMVGPYVVARLHDHLIFDGRSVFGKSANTITPFGTYSDEFDTDRWMVKAGLTGTFGHGPWSFDPGVDLIFFEEEQEAYTDSEGRNIPSVTVSFGRMVFGPQIGHRRTFAGGASLSSHVALLGVWDFGTEIGTADATAEVDDEVRAQIKAGVDAALASGIAIGAAAFYDGVGADDAEAYGGSLKLTVPF